jgi:hypothetical protein
VGDPFMRGSLSLECWGIGFYKNAELRWTMATTPLFLLLSALSSLWVQRKVDGKRVFMA